MTALMNAPKLLLIEKMKKKTHARSCQPAQLDHFGGVGGEGCGRKKKRTTACLYFLTVCAPQAIKVHKHEHDVKKKNSISQIKKI